MANITNYLNKIKTAVYGKDVRGAIHDAIKQVYDDASVNHDNANMEVKMARGTHNTLNDRLDKSEQKLDETNAQLSTKANTNDVRHNSTPIKLGDLHTEVKEAMTGGSVAVVGINAVGSENLKSGSVNFKQLHEEVRKSAIPIINQVDNVDFVDTTGWRKGYCDLSVSHNELHITGIGSGYGGASYYDAYYDTGLTNKNNHTYYLNIEYEVIASENPTRVRFGVGGVNRDVSNSVCGTTSVMSYLFTVPNETTGEITVRVSTYFSSADMATNAITKVKKITLIDVTEDFATDKTLLEMDNLLNNHDGIIKGSVNLFDAQYVMNSVELIDEMDKNVTLSAYNYLSNQKNDVFGKTEFEVTGDGTTNKLQAGVSLYNIEQIRPQNDSIIYCSCLCSVNTNECDELKISVRGNRGAEISNDFSVLHPKANNYYFLSTQLNSNHHTGDVLSYSIVANFKANQTQLNKKMKYKCGMILNLTEIFGKGNEPKKEVVDMLLSKFDDKHFYEYGNLFSANVLKSLRDDLYSNRGEYIRTHDLGNIIIASAPNKHWEKWQSAQYSYGMSRHSEVPIYNYIHGTLETDAMFSVHAKYSRWSPDCVYSSEGGHQWGGHVFEAWNRPRTYRYTVLIGKNAENEACVFTFAPPSPEVEGEEGGGGTFGITRIGSDKPGEGLEIKQKNGVFNGALQITEKLILPFREISTSTDRGNRGEVVWSDNYMYVCVNENYWKRIRLESF